MPISGMIKTCNKKLLSSLAPKYVIKIKRIYYNVFYSVGLYTVSIIVLLCYFYFWILLTFPTTIVHYTVIFKIRYLLQTVNPKPVVYRAYMFDIVWWLKHAAHYNTVFFWRLMHNKVVGVHHLWRYKDEQGLSAFRVKLS